MLLHSSILRKYLAVKNNILIYENVTSNVSRPLNICMKEMTQVVSFIILRKRELETVNKKPTFLILTS